MKSKTSRRNLLSALALAAPAAVFAQDAAKGPDFNGVWAKGGGGGGGENKYPQSQWSPTTLPFTPAGKKAFDGNKSGKGPRQIPPAFGNDPLGGANPPGLYRTLVYNLQPFEFIQMPKQVVQLFQWAKIWRIIYTDGRPVPEDVPAGPFWYGYSVGKWEGDTLVVTTLALDERAWLDEWGTPFSGDAKIEERWKRTGPTKLEMTITVNDPTFYTKPWTSDAKVYNFSPKTEMSEVIYAPMDEKVFNERIRDTAGGLKKK